MKLKTLKPHYYDAEYKHIGSVYTTDKVHGQSAVRNGLCQELEQPKRPIKKKKK